jgi:hypothetical protein
MPYLSKEEIRKMEALLENIKAVNTVGESPFVFLSNLKSLIKDCMLLITTKKGERK